MQFVPNTGTCTLIYVLLYPMLRIVQHELQRHIFPGKQFPVAQRSPLWFRCTWVHNATAMVWAREVFQDNAVVLENFCVSPSSKPGAAALRLAIAISRG